MGFAIKRHRLFVHPIQYRFLAANVLYLSLILVLLVIPVFVPLMQALDDPTLSYQARGMIADRFLGLHEWFWQWALAAILLLIVHSIHSVVMVHRIAGPLYRLQKVLGEVGGGALSVRARIRKHDYLHQETDALNRMLAQLQMIIDELESRLTRVCSGYDRLKMQLASGSDPALEESVRVLGDDLAHMKKHLDGFASRAQDALPVSRQEATQ